MRCRKCGFYIETDSTRFKGYCRDCKLWTDESSRCNKDIEEE